MFLYNFGRGAACSGISNFTQVLKSCALKNIIPKEIVWVDRKFPDTGGSTDIINSLRERGCIIQKITIDFQEYFKQEYPVKEHSELSFDLNDLNSFFDKIDISIKKKILIQLSFQQSDLKVTNKLLEQAKQDDRQIGFSFYQGLYNERIGKIEDSLTNFSDSIDKEDNMPQKILASHKLFRLSDGKIRKFKDISYEKIPRIFKEYVKFLEYSVITDKDGLDRDFAFKTCNNLPSIDEFIAESISTNWIRILIKIYSEFARIYYENEKYFEAHDFDVQAFTLAKTLADPEYIKSTVGNLGVSYMGLAYISENSDEKLHNWINAKKYLYESLTYSENFGQFHHALFQGDLGISEFYLGNAKDAIDLISKSLSKLKQIYPNFSLYFYGYLAYIYANQNNEKSIQKAIELIIDGVKLMQKLNEYDDIGKMKKGIDEINKFNKRPINKEFKDAVCIIENKLIEFRT